MTPPPSQVEYSFNFATAMPKEDWLGVVGWGEEPSASACVLRKSLLETSSGAVSIESLKYRILANRQPLSQLCLTCLAYSTLPNPLYQLNRAINAWWSTLRTTPPAVFVGAGRATIKYIEEAQKVHPHRSFFVFDARFVFVTPTRWEGAV